MKRLFYKLLFFFIAITNLYGQENSISSVASIPSLINPSFFSMYESSFVGLLYNSDFQGSGVIGNQQSVYGSSMFSEQKFTIGFEMNNKKYTNSSYVKNNFTLHYIYNLDLDGYWKLYPGVSAGLHTRKFDTQNFIFEDQINVLTGQINVSTSDPLFSLLNNQTYFSIGASGLLHNSENTMIGLSINNINSPNQSLVDGEIDKLKILMSAQVGYEIEIDKYDQSIILPTFTYLYLFNSFSTYNKKIKADLQQKLYLNDFYIVTTQQLNKFEGFNMFRTGLGVGVFLENIDLGFNYNFTTSLDSNFGIRSTEVYINFDLSRNAGRYRGDRSLFRHF
ncbi:MAG: PorP/SprF family type IX secretion system membrane protein [Flavobacteriaceae bacterium]